MLVASALALLGATGAQASTVTVGSVLPTTFTPEKFNQVQTLFNTALPETGANLVSPVSGAIVRWRIQGAKGGPFFLRVLHPNGKGAYAAHGTSGGATPTDAGLQTFTANISVEAGDLIGIDPTSAADEIGVATVAGASFANIFPPPIEGATVPASGGGKTGAEIELSAEVQPTPAVTSVSPFSGSIAGGSTVTITGHDFSGASAVNFGSTAAASFTVNSETQITATAPATKKVGGVDVTVKTLAGTSPTTRSDSFTYKGCVVPKLKGKTVKVSTKKLKNAGCKLGKVSGTKENKQATVIQQKPKPGKVLVPGSKVKVKVGVVAHSASH
jgi:hypothetical protein